VKFIVDNQLPLALARWLSGMGYDAVHVLDREQGKTADHSLWEEAIAEGRIMVSKDADFFQFATRPGDDGRLLWLRLGNCRTPALIATLGSLWPSIEAAFATGQNIVEVR
jgi:predicted nuclease of predicted toxin-antitoxin system